MANEDVGAASAGPSRDRFDFRGAKIDFHGAGQFGGGAPGPSARAASSNVPTPSATFVPRRNITSAIHAALQKNPGETVIRQVVTRAMGGYGKTVAAILYAHQYADKYPGGRFFLPMESGDIVAGLASLIGLLGLTSTNSAAADAAAVACVLRNGEPSLLILDNIASTEHWAAITGTGLLPFGVCRVLITTRDEGIDAANAIRIGRLTSEEAREVFARFCTGRRDKEPDEKKRAVLPPALPSDEVAAAITDGLGGLAVAVAAVAAYMNLKPHIDWKVYWEGDGRNLRGLKNTPVAQLPEVKPEVAAQLGLSGKPLEDHRRTLRVIDDAFDALPPAERRAVEYAALLPQDLAPAIWLEALLTADAARGEGPLRLTLLADPDDTLDPAQRVLDHLDRLDILLPGGEGGKLLSLHRLWHARVNERSVADKTDRGGLLIAIAYSAADRGLWLGNAGPDHVQRWIDAANRWELIPLLALAAPPRRLDFDHRDVALLLNQVAFMLDSLGRAAEAEPILREALAMRRRLFEGDHLEVANSLNNLACVLGSLGRAAEVEAIYREALAMLRRLFSGDHPDVANNLNNLAGALHDLGRAAEAELIYREALAMRRRLFSGAHPDVALNLNNLAVVLHSLGRTAEAEPIFREALAMRRRLFSGNHPDVANSLNNLAGVLQGLKREAEAEPIFREALAMRRRLFSGNHPDVAGSLNNLAGVLEKLSRTSEAESLYREALAMRRRLFEGDHPDVAYSLNNLAFMLGSLGRAAEAEPLALEAAQMILRVFSPDHPTSKAILSNRKMICGK